METKDGIQEKALASMKDIDRGTCVLSMGAGKSKLGLMWIDQYYTDYLKVLIAVPNKSILKSWTDDIVKFGYEHLIDCIRFTTYLSLTKQDLDYDLFIGDEIHSAKNSHIPWIANYKGKILGLTGTPPKLDHSERGILMNLYWPIRYTYETDDAVEDGILNDYRIIVHTLELDKAKTLQKKTKDGRIWMTSEENEYDYWTKRLNESSSMKETQIMRVMRMKALMGFPSKERLAKRLMSEIQGKTIVFANTIKQADDLCYYSYHTKNKLSEQNLEDFNSGKIRKLSCVLMLSQGVNIKGLTHSIIMHSYSNNRKLSQRLGRNLRLAVDEVAYINVLCYKDSIDQVWVKESLSEFSQDKITWL